MLIYGVGALSVLLCFCALLFDVGMFEQMRVRMQNAADAAALGAVFDYEDGGSFARGAVGDASLNGFTQGGTVSGTLSNPPTSGAYSGNSYAVQVSVTATAKSTFLPKSLVTLTTRATAMRVPTPCVYLLSRSTAQPSLQLVNDQISYSCPTYVGSSYTVSGTATTSSQLFVAANSTRSSGAAGPAAIFGAPSLVDPLSYLAPPTVGTTCTRTNTSAIITNTTLSPGTYCGGLTIGDSSHAPTVTFNPGTYILTGPLNVPQANVSGSGITIYIAGGSGSNASSILNIAGALSAPTSGTWQGILFYTDRSLAAATASLTMNNWNRSATMDGIFYLPNQALFTSNIALKPVKYLSVVADYSRMNNTDFEPAADFSSLPNGNPFRPIGGAGGLVE